MNKKSNCIKISILVSLLLISTLFSSTTLASDNTTFESKTNISTLKSWTVKLSSEIDPSSLSSNYIKITDDNGYPIKTTASVGEDKKSLIINPPLDGFIPNKDYFITINSNLKSITGKSLDNPVTMKFTTNNKYEDTSNFTDLPLVNNFKILQQPVLKNEKIHIQITSNTETDVQYRIFLYNYIDGIFDATYKYGAINYTELTNGFTSPIKGSSSYNFSSPKELSAGKYRILVYVKRANSQGEHSNIHTDYDNFYTDYIRVLEKDSTKTDSPNETYKFINSTKTLGQAVDIQYTKGEPNHDHSRIWVPVTPNIISYYMNPYNFLDDYGKYMFLDLRYMDGILHEDLNKILLGKKALQGTGQAFINAGKENNINPIYLVSHCLLETDNGSSELANGILVTEVDGQPVEPKIVYNQFGVGATNNDAIKFGAERAYKEGWFSVEESLSGGASFIGQSYINNPTYNQNTLYKMRWYTENQWAFPQYSTDIAWAYKQIRNIKILFDEINSGSPVFEIPVYK